jgi:four helix bundle protein
MAHTDLVVLNKALEAAGDAITLSIRLPTPLKSTADQVIRSASSVPANLAEGHGRSGRDRLHLWRIAYASAREVDCHLRLLARAGAFNRNKAEKVFETFDQVRAMTWRLLNPKTSRHAFGAVSSDRCRWRPPQSPAIARPSIWT